MKSFCQKHFLILFSLLLFSCGGSNTESILVIDSLLNYTLDLQARISSPEIQRLHEFQQEITLKLDEAAEDSLPARTEYASLQRSFDQCLSACSRYHEEAYMIEVELRELKKYAGGRKSDADSIRNKIAYEKELIEDLSVRIDTSIVFATQQARDFYVLRSLIKE